MKILFFFSFWISIVDYFLFYLHFDVAVVVVVVFFFIFVAGSTPDKLLLF